MKKPGPTGKYPQGKLNKDDQGELAIGIATYNRNVIINFGKEVSWLALPPEQAIEFAQTIIEKAKLLKN